MKTTVNKFNRLVEQRCSLVKEVFLKKIKEYAQDDNVFHNFEVGARIKQTTREEIMDGFMLKHYISYRDMLSSISKGELPSEKQIREKFGDIINYFILLEASMLERLEVEEDSGKRNLKENVCYPNK